MCSASEAPSLPGSGILMRPTLMRPNQDQIQAPVQPRQRRAEPEKGFRAAFFSFHYNVMIVLYISTCNEMKKRCTEPFLGLSTPLARLRQRSARRWRG